MKSLFVIPLGICLATTAVCAAPPAPTKVLLAQASATDHASELAQVKAGTLQTANASWWGFDKDNATKCLQNAISSGVPNLIIDNTGSDWIVDKSINLASNQHVILEDGVVIQAMKNKFKGKDDFLDSLMVGVKVHDVTIEGQGTATLRMQKADYANPALYEKAEWRHGIALSDSKNVTLKNFTVTKTGGDGLYLGASATGYNDNTLVDNMNFDDNYRQGISVISAQNLTIRNSKLNNTSGTDPEFGIDFEPNGSGQRLVNCVVEDSELTGNAQGGVNIYTVNMTGNSLPVSIAVSRCKISDNGNDGLSATTVKSTGNGVKGHATFTDCTFDGNQIFLHNTPVNSLQYLFKNCTIAFNKRGSNPWFAAAIILWTDGVKDASIGGITFDNTVVVNTDGEAPIATHFKTPAKLSNQIKGSLLVRSNGKTKPFDLAAFVQNK